MPPSSPTSFIPKQALERSDLRGPTGSVGLLFVLALVVLFVSGIILGGVLLYRSLLATEINAPCQGENGATRCGLAATVDREKKNIDQLTVRTLERLNKKLNLAQTLVADHNSPLAVFTLVSRNTLPSIRYSSFSYSDKNIELDGVATSYEDIAVQTGVWNEAKRRGEIQSFIFSDLNPSGESGISFKLTVVIDPKLTIVSSQPAVSTVETTTSAPAETVPSPTASTTSL